MKLQNIYDQLRRGELCQLSIGGENQGVINEKNHLVVLNAVNLGLANLHSRFNLKEGSLKLILVPGVYNYNLKSAFALGNPDSTELVRYIEGEFLDDLAKVEAVYTEEGHEIALNSRGKYSCSTPNTHTLRVPVSIVDQDIDLHTNLKTNALDVVYRALHPEIVPDEYFGLEIEEVEVDLPYPYLEPLLYFVAGRLHHPAGMVGDFQMGASYSAKYEQACQRLENINLQTDKGAENNKFIRNGWL